MVHWEEMRRGIGIVAAIAVLATGLLAWRMHARKTGRVDGPIVLISIDTLRADHLPVYGYTGVLTVFRSAA